jgi:hypothetical protein
VAIDWGYGAVPAPRGFQSGGTSGSASGSCPEAKSPDKVYISERKKKRSR